MKSDYASMYRSDISGTGTPNYSIPDLWAYEKTATFQPDPKISSIYDSNQAAWLLSGLANIQFG